MKHNRLVNAIRKAGFEVIQSDHREDSFHVANANLHWFKQDEEAICVHYASPHTDIMTDCFCDTFYNTIKSAVESLRRQNEV